MKTFNPFSAPACKKKIFRAGKSANAPSNSIFSGPVTNIILIVCIFVKILSRTTAKKKRKRLKDL